MCVGASHCVLKCDVSGFFVGVLSELNVPSGTLLCHWAVSVYAHVCTVWQQWVVGVFVCSVCVCQ